MHNIRGTFFTEVKCDPKHKQELIKRWHFLRNELAPADMTPSFQPVVRKYYIKVLQTGRLGKMTFCNVQEEIKNYQFK